MKKLHLTTAIVSIAMLGGAAQWANAQEAEDEASLEEIVVTGSRVLGIEDSTSPVVTVGQAEFEENPSITLADFLVENVTANNGQLTLVDESNQSGRIQGDRSTGINLWGLGEENTLTLLNGSRLVYNAAPSRTGWFNVDANSILPGIAMQRADILLDGGSAIYGTDAVAGVVNFIPRYGFEGMEFRVQSDFYPEAIGTTGSAAVEGLYGTSFGDDRGDFLVAFDYRQTTENLAAELGLNHADVPQWDGSDAFWAEYGEDMHTGGSGYDYSAAAPAAGGGGMGMGMGGGATASTLLADPLCGATDRIDMHYSQLGEIVPPGVDGSGSCAGYPLLDTDGRGSDRYTVFAALSYDFSDRVRGSAEVGYSERQIFDPTRFDPNDGAYTGTPIQVTFPDYHPGLAYNKQIDPAWAAATAPPPRRGMGPAGPAPVVSGGIPQSPVGFEDFAGYDASTINIRAGLDIQLSPMFQLDIGFTHGTSQASQARMVQKVENYLNAIDGLGGPNCNPATGTAGEGGCEFYNPFLSSALPDAASLGLANSPELLAWLVDPDLAVGHFETGLSAVDALLNIDTGWELPGGAVGWVIGADYRQEDTSQEYSPDYLAGGVSSMGVQTIGLQGFTDPLRPFAGEDRATSVFSEAVLPLADTLTMQLAVRHDEYDSVGGSANPKIGINFAPTDRVRLRASYGRSLKAPTIIHVNELVSATSIPTGPGMGRRGGHRVSSVDTGDPNIVPQTAVHTSVGGDFTLAEDVGALRSLQLSASYVTFDFKDRIVRLEAVARIPDAPGTGDCGILGPDRLYEEFFREDPDGLQCFDGVDANGDGKLQRTELTHAYASYTNIATSELEGVDLRLTAALDTPAGLMNLQLGGTQTLKFLSSERDPLAPPVDAVGRVGVLAFTAATLPEYQMVSRLSMRWGGGSHFTSLSGRYKSTILNSAGELRTGSFATWDLRHSWDINDMINLSFTARNVTGSSPARSATTVPIRDGVTSYFLNLRLLLGEGPGGGGGGGGGRGGR